MPSFLRPLPRGVTRLASYLAVAAWLAVMALLLDRSYIQASSTTLATDLARYGSGAVWRGVYYRALSTVREALMALSLATAGAMSIAIWLLSMRSGVRALQRMGE